MQHGESVLAYEQEPDAFNLCKIQRRVCFNGKLSGTFSLQSCQMNPDYYAFHEKFVVHNDYRPTNESLPLSLNASAGKVKELAPQVLPSDPFVSPISSRPLPPAPRVMT